MTSDHLVIPLEEDGSWWGEVQEDHECGAGRLEILYRDEYVLGPS
jgi:hypothetical protein